MDEREFPGPDGEETEVSPAEEAVGETVSLNVNEKKQQVPPFLRSTLEYLETFCYALAVLIVLFLFVFRYVAVDGDSMYPTLHGGKTTPQNDYHADRLIISDFFYTPKTGDIVVLNIADDHEPLIKRVIAVGGQTVKIDFANWKVWVDGVLLDEPYINRRDGVMHSAQMAEIYGMDEDGVCTFTVSEGKVFVMGDNRNDSRDSRFADIGEQDINHIMGRVIVRLYPFGEFGTIS